MYWVLRERGSGQCGWSRSEGGGAGSVHCRTSEAPREDFVFCLGVWAVRGVSRSDGFRWTFQKGSLPTIGQPGLDEGVTVVGGKEVDSGCVWR